MKLVPRIPRLPRASRRVLWWGGAVLAAMALWSAAPALLRRLAFFQVRQVELVGIRYLHPDAVLAALQLSPRASVFDDTRVLAQRVRHAVPGVAEVRIARRLPAALKVIVREVEPLALVALPRGNLVVVDAEGAVLPFDPARVGAGLDLPVVLGADTAVVGVLARIQALDPALFRDIDAARRLSRERDDVVLEYGPHRVLLTRDAGPEVVQAVALVTKDLAARARRYVELDARYAGQVIVRRRAGGGSGGSPRA